MCALSHLETVTAVFCWMGSNRLWCARHDSHMAFQRAKGFANAGLTLGFLNIAGCVHVDWRGMVRYVDVETVEWDTRCVPIFYHDPVSADLCEPGE